MENTAQASRVLSDDESAILRTLLYFSVFNYPLTAAEIMECSCVKCGVADFTVVLTSLVSSGRITQQGEFYLLSDNAEHAIERRLKGNLGASSIMPTARRFSRIIASFPFVRGICLSGALSKNYYDEKGDIDYFIVTAPGRLWICRTLLIFAYKLLPGKYKKYWCVNYFVSEDNLEIIDKNVFTGTEIAFLLPTYNYTLYKTLLHRNSWYRKYLPNKEVASGTECRPPGLELLKKAVEYFFAGWGGVLDDRLLRVTLRHWQKKYPDLKSEDFELQFRSRKNVCKRHSLGFQNRVLERWKEKQHHFEREHNVILSHY